VQLNVNAVSALNHFAKAQIDGKKKEATGDGGASSSPSQGMGLGFAGCAALPRQRAKSPASWQQAPLLVATARQLGALKASVKH